MLSYKTVSLEQGDVKSRNIIFFPGCVQRRVFVRSKYQREDTPEIFFYHAKGANEEQLKLVMKLAKFL